MRAPLKYRNKPIEIDGEWFASQWEARRYHELKLLLRVGQITELRRQPSWVLHAATESGEKIVVGIYKADFSYTDDQGQFIVEDAKGMATLPLSAWKQRHLLAEYGIAVREVRRTG